MNPNEHEDRVLKKMESKLDSDMDIFKIINTCLQQQIYIDEVLSDSQKSLLQYNSRYLLNSDENIVFRENYANQMATDAIIKNDELVSNTRRHNTFQNMSEFHRRVEQLTNMKLI